MTRERLEQVQNIYQAARQVQPARRDEYLGQACADDSELRREVDSLLAYGDKAENFLEAPALVRGPEALIGTSIAHYCITQLLGVGGMGEVYRAHDMKLARDVAIKVLPNAFAADPARLQRFAREAKVLASLNHPNIAAIYGLEEAGETRCLVLELAEGETLAERIQRGALPVREALTVAKQIAEALETAHAKGITHRDLKPANVKVTRDGTVKVLDFGLAKLVETVSPGTPEAPTRVTVSTPGMILGTPAYMSPEQAKGEEVGRSADIWAFGCVLYEMLTGQVVFEGETVGEILGGVFRAEPDWQRLPKETPEGIRRLLRRCLQKDRKLRLRDIGDACLEIADDSESPHESTSQPRNSKRRAALIFVSTFVPFVLIVIVTAILILHSTPQPPEVRFEINTQATTDPYSLAISPDGQKIVFTATTEGREQLWLRALDSVTVRALAGTVGAQFPFWSADSRSVVFSADFKLKRIDIDGGSVQELASFGNLNQGRSVGNQGGGASNRDGTILFVPGSVSPIYRTSATGGEPTAVTHLKPLQVGHHHPRFLPDGRHFLYYVDGGPEERGLYVSELDGPDTRRLLDTNSTGVYLSSGQLLFMRQGTLFTQTFDPDKLMLIGNPSSVAEHVAAWSASTVDSIIYRTGSAIVPRQFVWFDRSGRAIEKVGGPDSAFSQSPSLSPDGRTVAMYRDVNGNTDIWLLELGRGVLRRFTTDPTTDVNPVWSSDGSRIVFQSLRNGENDLYVKSTTSAGSETLLLATPQSKAPADWSSDDRFLLYRNSDPKTGFDIWALPFQDNGKPGMPFPVVQTNFEERDGQFSPDGKWIAYQSNESGRFEIYVQPFLGPGAKWPVSTNGGAQVRWRRDGKELFYIALDGQLMSVPIRFPSSGQPVEADTPVPLFATRVGGAVQGINRQQYMVAPDGNRFLMNTITEEGAAPITVILNWKPKP